MPYKPPAPNTQPNRQLSNTRINIPDNPRTTDEEWIAFWKQAHCTVSKIAENEPKLGDTLDQLLTVLQAALEIGDPNRRSVPAAHAVIAELSAVKNLLKVLMPVLPQQYRDSKLIKIVGGLFAS